jgi:CheY-like chemotaxis protein
VTGLGLAITKKLIELHGGSITVQSKGVRGSGTEFTFRLPRCKPEEISPSTTPPYAAQPQQTSIEHATDSVAANLNLLESDRPLILCVDDDPINLRILTNILRKNGYRTKNVASGREAIDYIIQHGKPDLMLLDVMMVSVMNHEIVLAIALSVL